MIDVEQRARRAGEAARIEAAERLRAGERSRTADERRAAPARWRPLAGVAAGALALVLVVLLVGQLTDLGIPLIEPAQPPPAQVDEPVAVDGVLPVPPVGDALAAYLEDGTPVFVSHPEEGEAFVLGALNPHVPLGQGKLVAFCRTSGQFEDLIHGARFNAWGDYAGGPAPSSLTDHPAELSADGGTIRIIGEPDGRRSRTDRRAEEPQRGPNCTDDPDDAPTSPHIVGHAVPDDAPALDDLEVAVGDWRWAEVEASGTARTVLVHRYLGGELLVVPAWPTDVSFEPLVSTDDLPPSLLRIPPPGEVRAEHLDDGAAVFVSRAETGDVYVLDATDPGAPARLVGWCPASGSFVSAAAGAWSSAGVGSPDVRGLSRYPFERVEDGGIEALRVTGPAQEPVATEGQLFSSARCHTEELVRHVPAPWAYVAREGLGTRDGWQWVEMSIEQIGAELKLCANYVPHGCGGSESEVDPTNADCIDDIGPDGLCPSERDPVVVTRGATASPRADDELLLVRSTGADGVEVRRPATSAP